MDNLIFQELDLLSRVNRMKNTADEVQDLYSYNRVLPGEEISEMETEFAAKNIEMQRLAEEAKKIADEFKTKINGLKNRAKELLSSIKDGREYVTETVFAFKDFEEGKIGIYNQYGELIEERRLSSRERQTTIFTARTGTND